MTNQTKNQRKGLLKKFLFFSTCSQGEFAIVSFFWKMIILSSITFVVVMVFSLGIFSRGEIQNKTSKSDLTIINSLTLNRGALSDVFEAYKKQEEIFDGDLKKVDSLFDPS
jgi:protein tyrosine phosphatase